MKIIYITSIGYSGSTLLDRLMESADSSLSVGEIDKLAKACRNNTTTQTGKSINRSEMWSSICSDIQKYRKANSKDYKLTEKLLGWVHPYFFKNGIYSDKRLFDAVRERAQKITQKPLDQIIDSSKNPLRMIALHKNDALDTKIIHLIRSPWGVVNSNIGHGRGWMMGCWRWLRTNIAIWWYTFWFVDHKDYIRIYYEDIARNPRKALGELDTKLNTGELPENYLEIINSRRSYRFGGNAMMRSDINEIKLDESWKEELSWYQKVTVGILCGPLYLLFMVFN